MKREKDWRGCLLIHLYEMCAEPQVDIRKRHKRESDVRGERADMSDRHAAHICCFREVG